MQKKTIPCWGIVPLFYICVYMCDNPQMTVSTDLPLKRFTNLNIVFITLNFLVLFYVLFQYAKLKKLFDLHKLFEAFFSSFFDNLKVLIC